MADYYTREQIIKELKDHFVNQNFECEEYSKGLGEVRLPLYCKRRQEGKDEEEIVVDVITESTISKEDYIPTISIQGATVEYACAPRFFQYYLPHAKVFWAHGYYMLKDKEYESFKTACKKNGLGILEVSDNAVTTMQDALSLRQIVIEQIENVVKKTITSGPQDQLIESLSDLFGRQQEEYIHYLVRYAAPKFQMRAITSRGTQDLSFLLINRLHEIRNLQYSENLSQLAVDYRKAAKADYEIASDTIQSLWNSRLETDYPEMRNFEAVLQLDPKYRDHFLHQFQVFLLGALIIDKLYNTAPIQEFKKSSGTALEDVWLAASTYHDFNYPIQKCEGWMTDFFQQNLLVSDKELVTLKLEKVVVTDEFLSKMQNLCTAIGCAFDDCVLRFILERAAIQRDHAVLGALTFLKKFQSNTRLTTIAAGHAALSILLHYEPNWQCFCGNKSDEHMPDWEREFSNKRLIPKLTFDRLPLAFLLTFCDAAQEWGRVGGDYEVTRPELEAIEIDQQRILIHISVEDDTSCNSKQTELQNLKQFLKDDRFGIEIRSRKGTMSTTIWMGGA